MCGYFSFPSMTWVGLAESNGTQQGGICIFSMGHPEADLLPTSCEVLYAKSFLDFTPRAIQRTSQFAPDELALLAQVGSLG